MKNKNVIKQDKELKLTVSTITRNGKKICDPKDQDKYFSERSAMSVIQMTYLLEHSMF